MRTNYATNLETPRAIGADLDVVDLRFDDGWRLDVEQVAERGAGRRRPGSSASPSPHNPTGTMFDRATLDGLVELAERSGAVLLVDETYRDLTHGEPLPLAATLSPRVLSVSSMSKAYGLPGLRIGWVVSRDPELAERLLAAKEQVLICGATLDERIAGSVLAAPGRRPAADPRRRARAARHRARRGWPGSRPSSGSSRRAAWWGWCGSGPRSEVDTDRFYEVLLADHGTYVGPGHWFELDDRHFRLGYGWPTHDELRAGLAGLVEAAASASA